MKNMLFIVLLFCGPMSRAVMLDEARHSRLQVEAVRDTLLENFPRGLELFESSLHNLSDDNFFVAMLFEIQRTHKLPPEQILESLSIAFVNTEKAELTLRILEHIHALGTTEAYALLAELAQSSKVSKIQRDIDIDMIQFERFRWWGTPTIQSEVARSLRKRLLLKRKPRVLNCERLLYL